jgi:hypothetical protein
MTAPNVQPTAARLPKANGADLARLQLARALELADAGERPLADKIADAANAAGADLLFMLPSPDGAGMSAMVRFGGAGEDRFLQIRTAEAGMTISKDDEIDPDLLRLARTSVDVLQRISTDPNVREPLTAPATY